MAQSPQPSRESQRRYATVMFADVSGFTALSGKLDPEELTLLMNECFALLEDCVTSHGGHVDKFIGDCIMALFGVPQALEHAARQAVNAAIEMRNRLAHFNTTERPPATLGIHIGINSGLVLAGDVGGQQKRDFTVMGDTVNLASRLKDASPTGDIWVGPQTYSDTRLDIAYEAVAPVTLKGIEQPVQPHRVTAVRTQRYRPRPIIDGTQDLVSDLVGRDAELAVLRERLAALATGQGSIVSIVAEAGLGKSRLVHEAIETAETSICRLEARSLAMGASLRFHPFVDLLHQWAGITDDDDPAEAATALERALTTTLGADASDALPFIATLAGARLDAEATARLEDIDGDALEKLLAKHLRDLLVALARTRPHVIVFEDLHWADQSSVKLLLALLPLVREQPLCCVLAYRPDYPRTSGAVLQEITTRWSASHTLVRLNPLDGKDCVHLLHNLLASADRPHPAWTRILARAEGNPFFIEEVIRSLIDQGAVVRTPRGYEVTAAIETVIVPATIQEVIMARVDRLPDHVRPILQLVAVVGRTAPYRILEAIVPDREPLGMGLAFLARAQLLQEHATGDEATWAFTHALAQETVYESMLLRTRKGLHLQVAQAIERLFASRLSEFHGQLAYHYSRGEDADKAEEYLFKAGEDAARSAASEEALTLFREASRLFIARYGEGGDPQKKSLLEKNIGLALLNRGDISESIPHFDTALGYLGERGPTTRPARVRALAGDLLRMTAYLYLGVAPQRRVEDWDREREVCFTLFNRGRAEIYSDPERLFFEAVAGVVRLSRMDAARIDQASAMWASCAGAFCYSGISFSISRRVLDVAKRFVREGNVRDRFTVATMEWVHRYLVGAWDGAAPIPEDLIDDAVRHGQLWDANTYLGLLCDQHVRRGEFGDAQKMLARLAVLRDEYGYGFAGGNYDGMLAIMLAEARRLPEALAAIDVYLAGRHEDALRTFGLGTRAKILLLSGDGDGAARALEEARGIITRSRVVPPWHRSAFAAADLRACALELESGRRDRATRRRAAHAVRYALRVASMVAMQRAEVHQLAGRVLATLGQRRRALRAWQQSLAAAKALGAGPELARTYLELAGFLGTDRVDDLDAGECRTRAQALIEQLSLAWDRTRLDALARAA